MYKIILMVHIVFGFLALVSGSSSIISKKGRRLHQASGKIFFYSMLGVSFSAVFISILKSNQFLLFIGVFAFYQNYSGYRAIRNKSLNPSYSDWAVLVISGVNSFFMIYSLNPILMVLGGINAIGVIGNLRVNLLILGGNAPEKMEWLRRHVVMMMGAFIATITAFLVVNVRIPESYGFPGWLIWLFPTMILTPLIIYYSRKYAPRLRNK